MNEGMNEPLILRARWHLQDNVTSENWRVAWNGVIVWEKGRLPLRENKGIQHSSSQRGHQDLETEGDGAAPVAQTHGLPRLFRIHLIAHTEKNGIII